MNENESGRCLFSIMQELTTSRYFLLLTSLHTTPSSSQSINTDHQLEASRQTSSSTIHFLLLIIPPLPQPPPPLLLRTHSDSPLPPCAHIHGFASILILLLQDDLNMAGR